MPCTMLKGKLRWHEAGLRGRFASVVAGKLRCWYCTEHHCVKHALTVVHVYTCVLTILELAVTYTHYSRPQLYTHAAPWDRGTVRLKPKVRTTAFREAAGRCGIQRGGSHIESATYTERKAQSNHSLPFSLLHSCCRKHLCARVPLTQARLG